MFFSFLEYDDNGVACFINSYFADVDANLRNFL